MKKIAIIGTENSHASAFASMLEGKTEVEIVGAYGNDPEANKRFQHNFDIDCSAISPHAFVGAVDGVMITSRAGSTHFESALPYLTPGMTVFIDKPITSNAAQAKELARIARERGVNLCGGSCLKYADTLQRLKKIVANTNEEICTAGFSAPLDIESPYDGFYFYAQHLVEMCICVLGDGIKSVYAVRCGSKVTVTLNYGSFCATLSFGTNIYHTTLVFNNFERHAAVNNVVGLYADELRYFLSLLSGKSMKYSYEDVIFPVIVLEAIHTSFTENRVVEISC